MNFTDTLQYGLIVDLFLVIMGFVFYVASESNTTTISRNIFRIGSVVSFLTAGIVTMLITIKFLGMLFLT